MEEMRSNCTFVAEMLHTLVMLEGMVDIEMSIDLGRGPLEAVLEEVPVAASFVMPALYMVVPWLAKVALWMEVILEVEVQKVDLARVILVVTVLPVELVVVMA